jgi:hypothetical protein
VEKTRNFFRDVEGREVDFIVTEKEKPIWAIECKYSDAEISSGLKYFKQRFPDCKAWQISMTGSKDYLSKESIHVCPAICFLQTLF